MTWKSAPILAIATLTLTGCYGDEVLETPLAVGAEESKYDQTRGTTASLNTVPGVFVLLGTTLTGKLFEIDISNGVGAVRMIGETSPFLNSSSVLVEPGWTGLTEVTDDNFIASSWDVDDASLDGCVPFFGTKKACTHIYPVDVGTGLASIDFGSTNVRDIYDIDANSSGTIYGSMELGFTTGLPSPLPRVNQAGRELPLAPLATSIPVVFGTPHWGDVGWLTSTTASVGTALIAPGPFSNPSINSGLDGGRFFVEGGLSVHPTTQEIWVAEGDFYWDGPGEPGPRLFTVDPVTGAATSVVPITDNGTVLDFGFSALDITRGGTFYASRDRANENTWVFELYEVDPLTGYITPVPLGPLPAALSTETISGLEATDIPPPAQSFAVTSATAEFDPAGVPGGDKFVVDADFVPATGSSVDLLTEPFSLVSGALQLLAAPRLIHWDQWWD